MNSKTNDPPLELEPKRRRTFWPMFVRLAAFLVTAVVGLSFLGPWYWGFDLLSHFRVYYAGAGFVLLFGAFLVRQRLAVLALGLVTGMALQYGETGSLLVLDHKTVLTITAFVVIGALLFAHFKTGLRGRKAARIVLLAYLLLTLGYPGVKFVTDVIMA
jgi:hypothetical protein